MPSERAMRSLPPTACRRWTLIRPLGRLRRSSVRHRTANRVRRSRGGLPYPRDERRLRSAVLSWRTPQLAFEPSPPRVVGRILKGDGPANLPVQQYPIFGSSFYRLGDPVSVSLIVTRFEWCLCRRRQRKHAFPFRRIPCTRRCKTPQTVSPSRRTQHTEQSFRRGSRSIHALEYSPKPPPRPLLIASARLPHHQRPPHLYRTYIRCHIDEYWRTSATAAPISYQFRSNCLFPTYWGC